MGSYRYFFLMERGVRQGCPISALLFINIELILAAKIRNDENIKGIYIPGSNRTREDITDNTTQDKTKQDRQDKARQGKTNR